MRVAVCRGGLTCDHTVRSASMSTRSSSTPDPSQDAVTRGRAAPRTQHRTRLAGARQNRGRQQVGEQRPQRGVAVAQAAATAARGKAREEARIKQRVADEHPMTGGQQTETVRSDMQVTSSRIPLNAPIPSQGLRRALARAQELDAPARLRAQPLHDQLGSRAVARGPYARRTQRKPGTGHVAPSHRPLPRQPRP